MTAAEFRKLLAERAPKRRAASTLNAAVADVLRGAERSFRRSERASDAWREFAGDALADRSHAYIDGGVCVVECDDPATFEAVMRVRGAFQAAQAATLGVVQVWVRRGTPSRQIAEIRGPVPTVPRNVSGGADGTD